MSMDESSVCHCDYGVTECPECNGDGYIWCTECGGKGQVNGEWGMIPCETCKGYGCFDCHTCNGTGYVTCQNCELGESRRRIGE